MIGRYVLAALLAGLIAGAVLAALQSWKLSPLIAVAETYEQAENLGAHTQGGHAHEAPEWQPALGLPRFGWTGLTSLVAGAGFAALLAGIALISNLPLTAANGWIWGLAGFFAVNLAPGFSLPPELPALPQPDLWARQVWWLGTVIASATAIFLLLRGGLWLASGCALLLLPHIIGAPKVVDAASHLPASIAAEFSSTALASAAIFWLVLGLLLGRFLPAISEKLD